MKPITAVGIGVFGSMAAAACAWAPGALADDTSLGSPADVGAGRQWTISDLRPSTDTIPYQPAGTLWEATATAQLADGGIPTVPGFAARGGDATYPVLWSVPTPQGVNPAALPAGGSITGKIYFDATAGAPTSVAYAVDGTDIAVWVQPPPPPAGSPAPAYTAPRAVAPAPAVTAPAPAVTAPAPAATGSSGTPAPAATGSSGTPLPETGSSGTPLPAEGSTAAPSTAAATPSTPAAPASTPPAASPAPAAASTTPATASAAPATPAVPTTTTAPR
jgi:hypothetical protein